MLNQAWWTGLAIINMSHRKRVWTLGSFFAPNQSQSESEKNDTEEEQCINQEETDEDRRKPKKSRDHTWLRYEKEAMFCYFCRKSKKTNPFASAEGCTNFCPPKTENVPQNFSQVDKYIVPQWSNPSSNPDHNLLVDENQKYILNLFF